MSLSKNLRLLVALLPCFVTMAAAQAHPDPSYKEKVVLAHGLIGCIAWVILFPLGGILIRLFNFKGVFWWHTIIQLVAYAMFCFVFASGVWFCWLFGSFIADHVILGMIIFILATAQPILGTLHHQNWKKYGRRTLSSILHIHLGRATITLAILNGGLGLQLAANATPAQIQVYGVVSGIIWLSYILIVSFKETVTIEQYHEKLLETESIDEEKRNYSVSHSIEERNLGVYES